MAGATPLCHHEARERWVEARMVELLPVPYFHVVFTVPEDLRDLGSGTSA